MRNVSGVFLLCFALLWPMMSLANDEVVPGEYLIKFKRQTTSTSAHNKIQGKAEMRKAFPGGRTFHIAMKPGQENRIEELSQDPDVEYIEPNFVVRKFDENNPGQMIEILSLSDIERQSYTGQTNGYYDQTGADIGATEAWAQALPYASNNRPIVAVVDTGLDASHYVFTQTSSVWTNTAEIPNNGVDDDFNGYVDDVSGWNFVSGHANYFDDQGHGTHVAGIVLGATMDILKTPPLSTSNIQIMPLKFLASNGSGTTSNAVSAIYYAVNNGAKVINCSWGGGAYSRSLHDAFAYAYSHGVLIVSAAGNYSNNNDVVEMYPANYDTPSNISVAASNDYDYLASFSNYGPGKVHLASPGVLVYSPVPGGYFGLMSGTSMAAPLVAGAAALAYREAPQLTGYQMKSLVLSSAKSISYLASSVSTGARLDVLRLLNEAQLQQFTSSSQPSYSPMYKAERGVASSSSSEDSGGGCGMIKAMGHGGPGGFSNLGWASLFLLLPVALWYFLRQRDPRNRRRYDRFQMNSSIRVMVGGRELTGQMQTISLGGLSFSAEEALEKGGIVSMKIASPDGKDLVEVEGRIVWSEENSAYGVKFAETEMTVLDKINMWTRQLAKSST